MEAAAVYLSSQVRNLLLAVMTDFGGTSGYSSGDEKAQAALKELQNQVAVMNAQLLLEVIKSDVLAYKM